MDELKNVCFTETEDILHIWRTHGPNAYLAIQICREFKLSKRFTELASFVEELPETSEYKMEEIIRFKIFVAWLRRNCQLVYKLIKVGQSLADKFSLLMTMRFHVPLE